MSNPGVSECLTALPADALGKPVLQTESKMWVDDISAECRLLVYTTPDPKVEIIAVAFTQLTLRDFAGFEAIFDSEGFLVRTAEPGDESAIHLVLKASYSVLLRGVYEDHVLDAFLPHIIHCEAELFSSQQFFVVMHQPSNSIVACGGWSQERVGTKETTEGLGHLRQFAVHPQWAGKGLGKRLFEACQRQGKEMNVTDFECCSSLLAEGFYRRLGLQTIGDKEVYVKDGIPPIPCSLTLGILGIGLVRQAYEDQPDILLNLRYTEHMNFDAQHKASIVVKGEVHGQEGVPARVHSECFTGDVLASKRCDCGQQLHKFMRVMNDVPFAILLYIKGQEGRGIGLLAKIRAYQLQDQGHDTVDANLKLGLPVDIRSYGDALFVLRDLGVKSVSLYTNNPDKMSALQSITKEVVAMPSVPCERNIGYLKTKKDRLNHRTVLETFKLPELSLPPSQLRIGIVYAMWNQYFVDELRLAAEAELERCRVEVLKMAVPGALELVSGARITLRHHKPDAVIVIGVLIKGSSDLYDRSCNAAREPSGGPEGTVNRYGTVARQVMTGLTELNAIQDTPGSSAMPAGPRVWQILSEPGGSEMCSNFSESGNRQNGADHWTMSFLQVVRREVAPLGTLGVIVANFLTKGLKLLVKRYGPEFLWRRPKESTRKAGDPGFPSSHTSNMTFISVYFALYLWLHLNWLPERSLLVALIPSSAMAAARICDKDHTVQQTIAGVLWGALLGLWWALIGPRLRGILEWAQPQPWALVVLCFVVGLPMFTKPLGLRLLPKGPTRRPRR
ncbi:unnamed protein product [Cladocopium goreaui]|uniref:Riboflavin biosynthesis protein RibBA n=1 Tax=Cladocopium goreaui TaxID=2562237 RepID=A0A9P1GTC1_9DINO|nr:unnamed protein product [Cladocopium goreaui]